MNSKPVPRNFLHRLVQLAAGGTVLLGLFVLAAWASGRWSIAAGGEERVPMAPGTAAAFAFLGLALWSWLQHPESRRARGLAAVCGAIVGVSAVMVLVPAGLGFVRPWTRWFPVIATTSAGIPVGYMSPITAAAFLLSAAGMLVQLLMPARRRMARWTGQTATLAAGLIGFVIAMGHAVGTAPFYGSGIIPMALLTALAFIVFNGGVLLAGGAAGGFWGQLFARPESETGTTRRRFAWRLVGLAVGLMVAIGGTAFLYLRQQQATVRQHVLDDLNTVADLKVEQIVNWRNERLSDARFFARAAFVARDLRTFLDDPAGATARAEVLDWLDLIKAGFRYKHVTLLNRRLQPLLSVPEGVDPGCALTLERAALKSGTNQVTVTDLHRGTGSNDVHLSILFRVFPVLPAGVDPPDAPQAMGVILLHLDPRQFLYPLIQSWPIQSRSAETLLVRREGTDVLFLNELRHQAASVLTVRIPLTQTNVPAVRAVLGERGLVSGEDYRGVPVVAAIRAIPDSPWYLVAKMDQAEIYAPLRWQAVLAGSVVGVLLLATGLGVTVLWRQRTEDLLRRDISERKQAEAALREARDFLSNLLDHASAPVIVWDASFRITLFNRAFEQLTGWRAVDVLGRELAFLFPPARRVRALDHVLRASAGEQLQSAEIPIAHADGSERVLLWNSAVVRGPADQRVRATIAQGQDITERLQVEAALRASLEEKTTLLKEVHHRVKNNLQVVMSLLNLQAVRVTNPDVLATLHDTRQRVRSMALLHETLYRSGNLTRVNLAAYVESLCAPLWRAQGDVRQRVRLDLRVADVSVGLEQAIPCGLLINELVSNALKHAFPGDRTGCVTVEIRRDAGRVRLSVADDGVGLPPEFDPHCTDTLGLQLVSLLAGQLHGTVECRRLPRGMEDTSPQRDADGSVPRGEGGTVFHVTFPVVEHASPIA